MMKKLLIPLLIVAVFAFSKTVVPSQQPTRGAEIKVHNINQVEMCVSNFGKFGQDDRGEAGLWWPKGSQENYIFGAGPWFGTIIDDDTLVTIGYGPHGAETEYVAGLKGMSPSDPDAIIFMAPSPWPPPVGKYEGAPQVTKSHQDSWCAYNDFDESQHVPGDTRPIGLEVYQTVYAWNLSSTQDIIFVKYELVNKSDDGIDFTGCYFGVCTDNDIGNESGTGNDIISGIVGQWYVIDGESLYVDNLGYQWQEEEEGGWSQFPGAIGFDYLQSPWDLVENADKDNDGILDQYERDSTYFWNTLPDSMWDVDLDGTPDWRDPSEIPQLGMTAFKRFTLNLEPNKDNERFVTLEGKNFKTLVYEPFDTIPPDPDDQRFLQCSGPFDLAYEDTAIVLVGIVLANWHDDFLRPDSALATIDGTAQFIYDKNWLLPGPPPPPNLTCVPGDKEITLVWDNASETYADPYYDIVSKPGPLFDPYYRQYDFEGYGIWRSLTGEAADWELLARYDFVNGIVFEDSAMDLSATDNGIVHSFVDSDVRNGFTYYYAVSAFDYNWVQDEDTTGPGYRALWFESGKVGLEAVPRRDPADYIPAGDAEVTVVAGSPRLSALLSAMVVVPFDLSADRPVYLEFGGPDTATVYVGVIVVDTTVYPNDTTIYPMPMDAAEYVGYIKNESRQKVDSVRFVTLLGRGFAEHEYMPLNGLALQGCFGTDQFETFVEVFDSVTVGGAYPDSLVSTAFSVRLPNVEDTLYSPYCHGFWAYRGTDYELTWSAKDAGGPVNTVTVVDVYTGDTIPYRPYQNDPATRHLGAGWCFTWYTTTTGNWTKASHDTLQALGSSGYRTRCIYLNGGLVALRNGVYVVDTIRPAAGDKWVVHANADLLPASVYGELEAMAQPPGWQTGAVELNVKVVPNPYLIHNEWQQSFAQRRLRFINLPSQCTIRVFNINGELVKTIRHYETVAPEEGVTVQNNMGGDEWWDLLSENRQLVASGIYIFHVQSDVGEQVGKFVVIR
jgi:hypothetical protein